MANLLTNRPIKVDTAMGANFGQGVTVRKVVWVAPSTLAHTFVIGDGSTGANPLLVGSAAAADVSGTINFDFDVPVRWKDFKVTTIQSGTLYIFAD